MGTFTTQILVGTPHQNNDGINPTHYVFLSENDRPSWILVHQNIFTEHEDNERIITWIPTIENMLEDALLMIAIHVCKNKEVIKLAKNFNAKIESQRVELYSDLEENNRKQLYEQCRQIPDFPKIIISVFRGSTIAQQLNVLEQYKMDVEVCKPIYSRLYSAWKQETMIDGSI